MKQSPYTRKGDSVKYFKECQYIWKNYVPAKGQSNVLQGEMLRQIEKLRYEAQNNGNRNWDEDFEYFCDFLTRALCSSDALSRQEKAQVQDALHKMKAAGQTALRYKNGQITDEELETKYHGELACTQDELYDLVNDAIGAFYVKNPTPIPYHPNPSIHR
ncbi:hypothetical protein [Diplocloster agilis]|uniref:Uncharacterized protein n=1 Tax=Diplocloster agilis TaxID=2850323 RepID=A0A949JVT2_9FIRM|nr:hypothetical protein [Diplocloster agilis]MBU9736073.1 hypothetical protein [Diplocloster agilis]